VCAERGEQTFAAGPADGAHPPQVAGEAAAVDEAGQGELPERLGIGRLPRSALTVTRLGWIQQHMATLTALVAELEARWTANGRMADGSLRPDEK
jgi:hypothetical protein